MNPVKTVRIGAHIQVGPGHPLLIIAGPCQIESKDHCLKMAYAIADIARKFPVQLVFKSSFDKANRTSGKSARGLGLEKGLEVLAAVRRETGLPVLTDVHSAEQVPAVAQAIDVLQTPAFLCRQTDLLLAVGASGKAAHVKKGQFLAPQDMSFAAEKIASQGNNNILLCERGTCFGYRDLVVDMRSLLIMRESGYPVVFDATHSVQQMGGMGGASGGMRHFIPPLVRAACATGVDGLFIECHDNPDTAPSDGPSMLPLSLFAETLKIACEISAIGRSQL
jgi:2-dehydro-3-deoxyphosphooctonate aldolase (KDO 8-P synthase)